LAAKSCGNPGDIKNGVKEGVVFSFTSKVTYTCDEGYELIGRANRYCQSNGQWSGVTPSCQREFQDLSLQKLLLLQLLMLLACISLDRAKTEHFVTQQDFRVDSREMREHRQIERD
jgi:hypothetical protein